MKITEAQYATTEKVRELFDLFNAQVKNEFHKFSVIII